MLLIISVIILVIFSAYLSAMETAVTAASPGKLQKLKLQGSFTAFTAIKLLKIKDKVISSLLTTNNLVNIIATTLATSAAIAIYGDDMGTVIASSVMSIVIIVFAEVTPKAIAVSKAEPIILHSTKPIKILLLLLTPINYSLSKIVKFVCWLFKIDLMSTVSATEEVRGLIDHQHEEGNAFNKTDREMLGGVLDIKNMEVSQIMIHRSKIKSINYDLPTKELISQVMDLSHSRIPIWRENTDNIIGILHIKDLLQELYARQFEINKINLKEIITEPWFIPEHAIVSHQLSAFKKTRHHIAMVVNEYGEFQGIVTLEDILEEIVGPVFDEHDSTVNDIVKINNFIYLIEGDTPIRDVNRELGLTLPDKDASTIAGLIIHAVQRIPSEGDVFQLFNLNITIQKMSSNYLKSIKVEILQ